MSRMASLHIQKEAILAGVRFVGLVEREVAILILRALYLVVACIDHVGLVGVGSLRRLPP